VTGRIGKLHGSTIGPYLYITTWTLSSQLDICWDPFVPSTAQGFHILKFYSLLRPSLIFYPLNSYPHFKPWLNSHLLEAHSEFPAMDIMPLSVSPKSQGNIPIITLLALPRNL
jgi:hypothetical protein